ncbi:MAG: SAP domain-containing protein [bacterium]
MRASDVRWIAKTMGIDTSHMKKAELIRAIQRRKDNVDCYGSIKGRQCEEIACLWRRDCILSVTEACR